MHRMKLGLCLHPTVVGEMNGEMNQNMDENMV